MTDPLELSPLTAADQPAVDQLLDQAFGLNRRTKTSYRLREGNSAVAELSFAVRDDDVGLAGIISYWPLKIGAAGTNALLLGPLAVHSQRQNRGIGKMLMLQSLQLAKSYGHALVILVGDAPYYERVGFSQIPVGQLQLPGPFDPKRFLALELTVNSLQAAKGMVLPAHRWRA
jgi:predicted N-acetyltransferase YhbS